MKKNWECSDCASVPKHCGGNYIAHLLPVASLNTLISDLCADEADQGKWSIDAALNKFKSSEEKYWKVALKSGVELNGKIFEKHICNTTPEDYADYEARYEVAFVTPCSHQVMMKVRFIYHTAENIFLSIFATL